MIPMLVMAGLGLASGAISGYAQANEAKKMAKQRREAQMAAIAENKAQIDKGNAMTAGLANTFLAKAYTLEGKDDWLKAAGSYDNLIQSNNQNKARLEQMNTELIAGKEPEVSGDFVLYNSILQGVNGMLSGASTGAGIENMYGDTGIGTDKWKVKDEPYKEKWA